MQRSDRFALAPLVLAFALAACSGDTLAPASDSGAAFAAVTSVFSDDFNVWDPGRWSAEEHPLGRGWFRPSNVVVSGGLLRLVSPAGTLDGGEIASLGSFGSGTFTARFRCGMPEGTVCAFFLYEGVPGNRNDEIDIEILSGTRTLWVTTWSRGQQTNHAGITLPFDPAGAFHDYTIVYDRRSVAFEVDGAVVAEFTKRLPRKSMRLLANAWWPSWMADSPATADGAMEIDWIVAG